MAQATLMYTPPSEEDVQLVSGDATPEIVSCKSNAGLDYFGLHRKQTYRRVTYGFLASAALLCITCGFIRRSDAATSSRSAHSYAPPSRQLDLSTRRSCMTHGGMPACPAVGMFLDSKIQAIATDNLMRVGRGLVKFEERGVVNNVVAKVFKNVSLQIMIEAPRLASELEMIQLNANQMFAVTTALKLLSKRDVQRIGINVAMAIQRSFSEGMSRASLRSEIERWMSSITNDVAQLRAKVVPKALAMFWAKANHQWEMTLDLENLRFMQIGSGDLVESAPKPANILIGIEDGALVQARALIDLIRLSATLFGKDIQVPSEVASLSRLHDANNRVSCKVSNVEVNKVDPLKAWLCPLKFGSQGVDALRALAGSTDSDLSVS